jgi:hypothetical protein
MDPSDPQCSISELLSVSTDPVGAVTAMLATNIGCAMCLVPCASAADPLFCAMGCLKQDEGACSAEELAAIDAMGSMPSGLADRDQIVRVFEMCARACVRCILETIASVCGVDCVPARLHIVTDYPYSPRPCLPELAARISVGEASAFERAVAANEPFGLTVPAMADLFVYSSTIGPLQSHKLYKGIDSGMLAYECDPAIHGRVWAFRAAPSAFSSSANSTSADSLDTCSGELQIELESGQAHSQPASADGSSRVPIRFDLHWADCSTFLPSFESIRPSTNAMTLDGGTPQTRAAACWLSRFFGPQAHRQGLRSFAIELLGTSVALESDLVVRSGTTLRLTSSARTTVVIGPHQIRVESEARLELDGLTLADSVQSSALVVGGSAAALRTTFIRCRATTNMVLGGIMDSLVPDGLGAFLTAAGAAVHIAPHASMEIVDSALLECSVGGAKVGAGGGAIFVNSKAQLVVLRSELRRNSVEGGAYCSGGALWLHIGANATLSESVLGANVARNAAKLTMGGAAMIFFGSRMLVLKTEVCHNLAASKGEYVLGGSLYVYTSARLAVSESLLCHNLVENYDAGGCGGGAIAGYGRSLVTLMRTVLQSNTARGGFYTSGGAVYMASLSTAHVAETKFVGNSVDGARSGLTSLSNKGGALRLDIGVRARLIDSEFLNNTVTGMNSLGGAIWSAAQSAVLVNTSLQENKVIATYREGYGGAISVSAGLLGLDNCRVHDNLAESLRGSLVAGAGAIHATAGTVHIEGSSLRGNRMGGHGISQAETSASAGGAHIGAEGGSIILDSCSVADDGENGDEARLENAAEWWMVAIQSLILRNSSFRSVTPGQGLLRIQGSQLQLMIRGCAFENLRLSVAGDVSAQPIGVVDSTFAPALDPSIPTVQPTSGSGTCAVQLASEQVCDARALCEGVPSGGVRCSCVGSGLRYKPGVPEDGRQCEQDSKLTAALQTQVVSIAIKKPGVGRDTLRAIMQATGERPYSFGLSVNVSRLDGALWPMSRVVVGSVTGVPNNQPSASAFGQHIKWHNQSLYWVADLDETRQKHSDRTEQEFEIHLEKCEDKHNCATDGDILETILSVTSQQDTGVGSQVTILTTVESLISCENSKAQMTQAGKIAHGNSVSAESALTILVQAVDVDGHMITRTRAEIEFRCSNQTLLLRPWSPGSNEYVAEIPADLLLRLGQFDLVVRALNGWNQTSREMVPCDLLRVRMFATASQPLSPTWIIVIGLLIGILCMLGGLFLCWYSSSSNAARRLAARKLRLLNDLQKKYEITGKLGPMDRAFPDGSLPIHIALECGAPHMLVMAMLSKYPEGARAADARGNLPLHLLLQGLSSQMDWQEAHSSMSLLLAAFPGGKVQRDMHSKLPVQMLLDACLPAAGSCALGVELGFPLDCNGSAGNWLYLIANSPPNSAMLHSHATPVLSSDLLVEEIIKHAQESRRATIQQLAYATDTGGREAWAVATKENRKRLWKHLLFCGRYDSRSTWSVTAERQTYAYSTDA